MEWKFRKIHVITFACVLMFYAVVLCAFFTHAVPTGKFQFVCLTDGDGIPLSPAMSCIVYAFFLWIAYPLLAASGAVLIVEPIWIVHRVIYHRKPKDHTVIEYGMTFAFIVSGFCMILMAGSLIFGIIEFR